ncbi:UNVERIFIED_CONTAM: hypothetical protein ABIC26_002573 [Paenibacillus sp. PvR008]
MDLTTGQRWVAFQAIEDKLFSLQFKIKDYETLEQTKKMVYHIANLKKDQKELQEVRNILQREIELSTK